MPVVGAYMFVCFLFVWLYSNVGSGQKNKSKDGKMQFRFDGWNRQQRGRASDISIFRGHGSGIWLGQSDKACRQCHRSGQRAKSPSVYVSHNAKVRAVFGISDAKVFKHNGIRCLGWNSEFG